MRFIVDQRDICEQTAHVLVSTIGPQSKMDCGVAGTFRDRVDGPV